MVFVPSQCPNKVCQSVSTWPWQRPSSWGLSAPSLTPVVCPGVDSSPRRVDLRRKVPASISLTHYLHSVLSMRPAPTLACWLTPCFLGSVSLCFSVYLFPCLSFLWYLALEIQSSFMVLGLLDSSWTDHKQSDVGNSICLMSSFNICNRP